VVVFNYEYHLLFAVLILLVIEKYILPGLGIVAIFGCLASFYIPDLDSKTSKPSKSIPIISKTISWIIRLFTKHRGITHSLLFMFMISSIAFQLCGYSADLDFFYGVIIGYSSHLFSDMFTPMGVPLLWPIKFRFKIPILSSFPKLSVVLLTIIFLYLLMNDVNFIMPKFKMW
jgi:inner membrane protein